MRVKPQFGYVARLRATICRNVSRVYALIECFNFPIHKSTLDLSIQGFLFIRPRFVLLYNQ